MTSLRRAPSAHSTSSEKSSLSIPSTLPKVDFQRLLAGRTRTPVSLEEYRDYLLHHEYGAECLDFWLAVQELRTGQRSSQIILPSPPTVDTKISLELAPSLNLTTSMAQTPTSPKIFDLSRGNTVGFSFEGSPPGLAVPEKVAGGHGLAEVVPPSKTTHGVGKLGVGRDAANTPVTIGEIIDRFIRPGAPEEINVRSGAREEIMSAYRNGTCTADTLLSAQRHCYDLMLLNSLPRFLGSATVAKNIARPQIHARAILGGFMALASIAIIICSFTVPSFSRNMRWLLSFPASFAYVCFLQVWTEFCVIYGFLRKARNIGTSLIGKGSGIRTIEEPCVRVSYMYRSLIYVAISLTFGFALAGILFAIPYHPH